MKLIKTLALSFVVLIGASANAQDLKFAHIDVQKLLSEIPEKVAAEKTLQDEAKKLEDQLKVMGNDLQQKYQEYVAKADSLPELIRATKEKEIQDADQRIKNYQQMARQSLSQKEQQLLAPIIEKVQKAIDEVGADNGYIYIFDVSSQVILFHSDKSIDAAPLVKAKLGVQ